MGGFEPSARVAASQHPYQACGDEDSGKLLLVRPWLVAPDWPREYGGMGASLTQQIILFEEMMRIGAEPPYPHGLSFIGPIIIHSGTPEQKARFLPRILSGEDTWCQGYSEPEAGSDLASLKTTAQLVGNEFIVNGHKVWTTNGHYADWMFALVRTDPAAVPRDAGLSLLLIDLKSPGVTVRPIETIKGDTEFAEEILENVRVPRANTARAPRGRSARLYGLLSTGCTTAGRRSAAGWHASLDKSRRWRTMGECV